MQRVDQPLYAHAKASCYVCGSAQYGIDFEVFIEGEGVLFLCRACVTEAATTLGLKLADPAIERQLHEVQAELEASKEARNAAETMLIQLQTRAKEVTDNRMARARAAQKKQAVDA